MPNLKTEFETATQAVQKLPKKPDDQTLLKLYAFYKQATVGNASAPKPASPISSVGRSTTPGRR